jgi:hypothetical protein
MLKLQRLGGRVGTGAASIVVSIAMSAKGANVGIRIALAAVQLTPQKRSFKLDGYNVCFGRKRRHLNIE